MQKILFFILKILAQAKLRKEKPKIVAVTGSVGKSTTKEMIYFVLRENFRVRRNPGNYNNEIGLPLAILNCKMQGRNILGWLFVFLIGFARLIFERDYPQILILEMAADKPGDISYLTEIAKPDIAVITNIGPSHLEFFGALENVYQEKKILVQKMKDSGTVILNFDDKYLRELGLETEKKVISIGFLMKADVCAENIKTEKKGVAFTLLAEGSSLPLTIKNIAKHDVYAALFAVAVGIDLGMDLVTISRGLSKFVPLKGRTRIFSGIKNTILIDDTYNSNPVSLAAAFKLVKTLSQKEKYGRIVFVLGDMLELGKFSKKYHFQMGKEASEIADVIIAVGKEAKGFVRGARSVKKIKTYQFFNSREAAAEIKNIIKSDDLILIKASQGMRLEKVVEKLLLKQSDKIKLSRQEEIWQR